MSGGPPITGYPDMRGGGYPISYHPGGYPVSVNPAGAPREELDTSRTSQASYGSRESRSSGTVHLGGSDYPIGGTVGSSGLFVIGDPSGNVNKSTDSVRTSQSVISQYSSVVGGELQPSKGYDFEDWNWPVIRCSCLVLLVAIMVSLLIATIATAVALNKTCDSRYDWWQGTVLYHINVSEFHNSDGNNIGDLRGVEERVDYFKYLGVHAVILNNFIQAMHPFWDKITSYTAIDSRIGTMEDFVSMIKTLHDNNIKVLIELNAVFTSEQHEWFLESQRQSSVQNNIYANVYNWKFPKKPSDGYNWFLQPVRNEYYEYDPISNETFKPLLNWDNTRTQILIQEVLEFWLKLGVDGFYMPRVRQYSSVADIAGRMNTIVRGWAGKLQTFSQETDGQKRVLMIDALDLELIEKSQPAHLKDLLQAVDLINVQIRVDRNNITGSLVAQMERGMHWQEDILDHPDAPWVSFTLVDISRIEQRHLAIVEFFLFYLPGTPVLKYGQEIGRDPENQEIPGQRISPIRWNGDSAKPYESGSILDVTTLDRFVNVIKARMRYESMRAGGYEFDGDKYRGYALLFWDKKIILMKRTQYQEESVFFAANFEDVRAEKDWSQFTSYGSYISDSSGLLSGQLQLNSITVPKETAVIFSDII